MIEGLSARWLPASALRRLPPFRYVPCSAHPSPGGVTWRRSWRGSRRRRRRRRRRKEWRRQRRRPRRRRGGGGCARGGP
eukprot:914634-Prorocentrum_minimum.AAC.1